MATTPGHRSAGGADADLPFRIESINRISDRVAEQIRNYIVDQRLNEGERLPSERRLAELVGSSRPTVSQALRTLSLQGLVKIRPGAGAFVLRNPSSMVDTSVNLMLQLEPESLAEAAHLRFLLEITAGRQAVAREQHDLEPLHQALADLVDARGSVSEWIALDTVFHVEVVRLAGNRFLTSMFTSIHTALVARAYEPWVTAKKAPRWLTGAAFQQQIALHEPMANALARRELREFEQAAIVHQEALLQHLGLKVSDWARGI